MFQTQLIHQVVDWEKRLEIEEEKRKNHRTVEVYANYLAPVPPCRRIRRSLMARILDRQPECPCYTQGCCPEVQPG